MADTQFTVRQMTRDDVPLGKGQCDIRLYVDGEAEVRVQGNRVRIRTISGREPRDAGSECNDFLPGRNVENFRFEVGDRRGDIALLSEPSARSGFAAVVRIRDNDGGEGRYHFRLSWQMTGSTPGRIGPGTPGGPRGNDRSGQGGWNRGPGNKSRELNFNGRGQGRYSRGKGAQRFHIVSLRIGRGGDVSANFDTSEPGRLNFHGRVIRFEGDRIIADVTSNAIRGHGTMTILLGPDDRVRNISIDQGSGRDRFELQWSDR